MPTIVEHTDRARQRLIEIRKQADAEYAKAEERSDPVSTTVWGRVSEQTRKLALIYAASENHRSPQIDLPAVEWASRFVMHQVRRMLYMASMHVSDSEFEKQCKRLIEVLRDWRDKHGDRWMPYREVSRKLRWSRREHDEVRAALSDQERMEWDTLNTAGRPKLLYRVL